MAALQLIFQTKIEFTEDSFEELNQAQFAAYRRDHGDPGERIYRVVHFEPSANRSDDGTRVTLELSIVTETERQHLLDAMKLIYGATQSMREPSFAERLEDLRRQFLSNFIVKVI
jgi:hypothetical protein